jgi:hypothetical protein
VLDGIEHVGLDTSRKNIESPLNVVDVHISRVSQHGKNPKVFKILFTTAGNCASLNRLASEDLKIVKASAKSAK